MIPLLPNPFNPEDTEFVLDSDAFMAALASDRAANARFLLEQEVAEMRKSLAAYGRGDHAPSIAPDRDANKRAYPLPKQEPRFAPDAAGRRIDSTRQEPMPDQTAPKAIVPDEDALFYLAGTEPLSIAPDHPLDRSTRK